MRRILVKSIMFVSSYFPLYAFLLVLQFDNYKEVFYGQFSIVPLFFFLCMAMLILISIFSVYLLKKMRPTNNCSVEELKKTDEKAISYVFTYVLPILSISMSDTKLLIVNLLLFLLIWFLYVKLDLLYLNPLWAIFGYVPFECKRGCVISDMRFDEILNKRELRGTYIANGIFVAKKKDNTQ